VLSASLRPLSSGRYRRTAYNIVRIEGAEPTEDVIINGSVVIRPQCGFRSLSSSDPAPTGVTSPDASLFDVDGCPGEEEVETDAERASRKANSSRRSMIKLHGEPSSESDDDSDSMSVVHEDMRRADAGAGSDPRPNLDASDDSEAAHAWAPQGL
jgi:hypothetical protein